ncbi:dipeptide epimerase [Rhodanobacter sp. Col0626]|uniref:dipeptide epimerase n=1 Tax=Rhodanobacter sp. Col0626 TaxID=3415679 RepID=UPI003CEF17ED
MSTEGHAPLRLQVGIEKWAMTAPFHITGYTFTEIETLVVTLHEDGRSGRGEALGVYYHHDTPASMLLQVEALRERIEAGVTRQQLLQLLPAGGARNAIDCALWDLEAKRSGRPVWMLAGQETPRPLLTTYTLGADEPARMAETARGFANVRALKLKLTNDELNADRVRAVRAVHPDAWIMVDANQGFTRESFAQLLPALVETRVAVVEQPFPVGKEAWLDGLDSPIRIAADESVQDHHDLPTLVGRVGMINIKLDKCGGLTEALAMAEQARGLGFELMVGNMSGSSLSMAPGFVLGQSCAVVDLDGPMFLTGDHSPGVVYEDGRIWCADTVWGGPLPVAA